MQGRCAKWPVALHGFGGWRGLEGRLHRPHATGPADSRAAASTLRRTGIFPSTLLLLLVPSYTPIQTWKPQPDRHRHEKNAVGKINGRGEPTARRRMDGRAGRATPSLVRAPAASLSNPDVRRRQAASSWNTIVCYHPGLTLISTCFGRACLTGRTIGALRHPWGLSSCTYSHHITHDTRHSPATPALACTVSPECSRHARVPPP